MPWLLQFASLLFLLFLLPGITSPDYSLAKCDAYTREETGNYSLTCAQGLLAHSGADYLRRILPTSRGTRGVRSDQGIAKLRLLDSFTITSAALGGCNYTRLGDG